MSEMVCIELPNAFGIAGQQKNVLFFGKRALSVWPITFMLFGLSRAFVIDLSQIVAPKAHSNLKSIVANLFTTA